MSVFVIINEWTDLKGATSSEVTGGSYFETELDAWASLRDIAHAYEDDLDYDATSLTYEDHAPGLQAEEYYIQELNKL